MSSQYFAAFLQSIGHNVFQHADTWWYDVHPHVYMSFPFHRELDAFQFDPQPIFRAGAWALRYPCPVNQGRPSYILLATNKEYDLPSLSGKARNQTRRGLEACSVEQIDFADLCTDGITLNRETMLRQGRRVPKNHDIYWQTYYRRAATTPGAEAWGAFYQGRLIAFLISFLLGGCANILIVRSRREFLKYYPNNALMFVYLRKTLKRREVDKVSIGLESLQAGLGSLDHFKLGMGFTRHPVGQRIELNRLLRVCCRGQLGKYALLLAEKKNDDERFGKVAGMLKWYQEQPLL